MEKFIIDADTGSDDAVAILLALRDPSVEILGISIVIFFQYFMDL